MLGDVRSAPREHPWRTHSKKRKVSGECNVIAYFIDDEKTKLCVRVTRAKDIKAADLGGTSDPYVRATLTTPIKDPETGREDQIFKTKVVWKTIEPTWNHNFIFRVWPSTDAQIKAAETTKIGVLGTIVNGVYGGLDSFKKATGCKKIDEVEARERREKREVKAKLKALKREEKARKKKRAYKASDFKTIDVAARAKRDAIERRAMITSLGGGDAGGGGGRGKGSDKSKGGGVASFDAVAFGGGNGGASGVQIVKGQILELDLFDFDEGSSDDFLGRILLPLEQIPTASQGGDKVRPLPIRSRSRVASSVVSRRGLPPSFRVQYSTRSRSFTRASLSTLDR